MTPVGWILPFAALLAAIAAAPVLAPRAWERASVHAAVAAAAAAPPAVWLLLRRPALLAHLAADYLSFVLLLGALYVVTAGISIHGDVPARPATNAALLGAGGILASLIGTTGASMLLIRPLLDVNAERKRVAHTVFFFILVVSNIGGALLPLGDPPLFLGYLSGVPFLWTLKILPLWAVSLGVLLALYLAVDLRAWRLESPADREADETTRRPFRIRGAANLPLLAGIVAATALLPPLLREGAYLACAASSLLAATPAGLRAEVGFSWRPIREVAILFAGLFVSMGPALEVLREQAPRLGLTEAWQFFWATGLVSSVLDNAPTYAAFLALARGLGRPEVAGAPEGVLRALSAGAVFFGAMTYVGNAPNFLVRSIAASKGVKMPSFAVYTAWAAAALLPLFILLTWLFFAP